MGVPATVWDVAGTGFGTWACGCGLGQQQKRSIHMVRPLHKFPIRRYDLLYLEKPLGLYQITHKWCYHERHE